MANLAVALREAIRRIARREVRAETIKAKRSLVQYRREIVKLKRQLQEAQRRLALVEASARQEGGQTPDKPTEPELKIRFSPRWVRAQRRRLGLSAEDYGKLLGVSRLTVYHWEKGISRPRPQLLQALAALRKVGRREARARLAELQSAAENSESSPSAQRTHKKG
jgi:DNA-binding transcriptional regulator YiaG